MQTETHTPVAPAPAIPPSFITVTEAAASKIKDLLAEENKTDSGLRVFVQGGGCSGFQYGLMIEEAGGGFTIKNPNATSTCGCGSSFNV